MSVYEIINPSDPYTLKSDDRAAACAAVLLLGQGLYTLQEVGEGRFATPFFFAGANPDATTWFREKFGEELRDVLAARRPAVVAALRSVLIGNPRDRWTYEKAAEFMPSETRQSWLEVWHEGRRTSMNDIGRRAWALADELDGPRQAPAPAEAPAQ